MCRLRGYPKDTWALLHDGNAGHAECGEPAPWIPAVRLTYNMVIDYYCLCSVNLLLTAGPGL